MLLGIAGIHVNMPTLLDLNKENENGFLCKERNRHPPVDSREGEKSTPDQGAGRSGDPSFLLIWVPAIGVPPQIAPPPPAYRR